MKIEYVYHKFLEKVNKNVNNDNLRADKKRFILAINEAKDEVQEYILDKRNEDDIEYIQQLLVFDKKLNFDKNTLNHYDFDLPEDYFYYANVRLFAKQGDCSDWLRFVHQLKAENREAVLSDENSKPSYKYRQSYIFIAGNQLKVYTDNEFSIDKAYLTYYRYAKNMDIEGYYKEDGVLSTNIDPELDDKLMNRIITIAAKNYLSNNLGDVGVLKDKFFSKV